LPVTSFALPLKGWHQINPLLNELTVVQVIH